MVVATTMAPSTTMITASSTIIVKRAVVVLSLFSATVNNLSFAYYVSSPPATTRHHSSRYQEQHRRLALFPPLRASSIDVGVELSNDESESSDCDTQFGISSLVDLPRHSMNEGVNEILTETEHLIKSMHEQETSCSIVDLVSSSSSGGAGDRRRSLTSTYGVTGTQQQPVSHQKEGTGYLNSLTENSSSSSSSVPNINPNEVIYANTYVDFGKVDTIGFDYDYTLVTYTTELLELLYDMALRRLVNDRHYPLEMLSAGMVYDPFFSVRGLAVDKETGWICHLSYTHKVAVAWEGRNKLPTSRIYKEYRGKRALTPTERRQRLKPLNDLFSMAECCLIADTIQFFKENEIDFCPSNVVTDILGSITQTHISGDFHRIVAANPEVYFNPTPHLKSMLTQLKNSGKRLIFASNSPFWYVDAGMKYTLGDDWKKMWDVVIVSAGKPSFYTETKRPFREVNDETNRVRFQKVEKLEPGKVYTEGCINELTELLKQQDLTTSTVNGNNNDDDDEVFDEDDDARKKTNKYMGALSMNSNVLYVGDSLFADLVDAKRDYGWITAAVVPEVGFELEIQQESEYILVEKTIEFILNALRLVQAEMGPVQRSEEDSRVLDGLERLVSRWRDRETELLGNPFGSVFRARYQPSLFAHSLRRYCDLYMNSVGSLRLYSSQHRFYPEPGFRLLAHEISRANKADCWDILDESLIEMDE
mmetsp:Transcript_20633/g.48954  ORF Transcript_20633/g.48954 Transcript_20633/m.48954 type:complete len:705 (-) Transcript_20633:88-2202(-)